LNGKKLFIEKIQQSNDTNKLEPGSIKLTKDHAIMIGLKDINVIVTPNLSKSDFNNMQDLIDFILQVLNKVQ